jgi:cell wall-associated NlpC family hydrolase
VDPARDLGRVDVWEESLKRSLERRGRPRRASVELYRLRPARDLTLADVLERSSHYSELRRRAAQRSAMPRPSVALGGISALALVAGSTLPSLLGGGRAAKKERVTYAEAAHTQARTEAAVSGSRSGTGERAATSALHRAARATVSRTARQPSVTAGRASGGVGLAGTSGQTGQARVQLVSDQTPVRPEATASEARGSVVSAPVVTEERVASPNAAVHYTGGVPVATVPARHLPPSDATAPATDTTSPPAGDVQAGIQKMIAAGNRIARTPYIYGGGHGSFNSRGYDCSGSVSYVLHAAGLLRSPEDSTELESYGQPGPGRYVSIYANSGHAFMTIQGRRFDTVAQAQTGSRWSNHMVSTAGYVVRHPTHY